ncbi:MAG: DUF3619 family protein [Betaproteobacteria bacterium]|jgi:hypothetical protein|nr:DUF3619 family protein [Betaproteobacteria bacterium]
MNEHDFANVISKLLNQGTQDLDPLVLGRLRAQRHALLSNLAHGDSLVWSGGATVGMAAGRVGRWSLVTVMLVGSLVFCGLWWQTLRQERVADEAGFLEAKLLSAEIPPQDFAQQDFSEWLRQGH